MNRIIYEGEPFALGFEGEDTWFVALKDINLKDLFEITAYRELRKDPAATCEKINGEVIGYIMKNDLAQIRHPSFALHEIGRDTTARYFISEEFNDSEFPWRLGET